MASPSPSSSSSSPPFNFSALPVMSLKERIVEKIRQNRVTLIVGETGCGKSSQIPQFLLEEDMGPIICTQPRRFAVVAIANMVARARNCNMGDEVGYHIGHSKHSSERSKIVFKTAGVLLEEMRDRGLNALNYKVIVLDEVHERSVESDLVLVCVKQFLSKNHDLRVVLMSATADIGRYRDYFKDLGRGERVEVLAIPSSNQKTFFERKVSYLEEVIELLGIGSDLQSPRYCNGTSLSTSAADIRPEVHKLIHNLLLHIHKNEPDIEKSILIFLPTYYSLEQQWDLLKSHSSFKVYILHSSIDIEQALTAMKIWKSRRKVILATNIAESSVTIPKVAYVIDSCRALQVYWDNNQKKDSAQVVWISKSQAEQRRGRTGRTCDGQVYRLVTRSFYQNFEDFERPAILRLSLRQQVLLICSTESKAINDPIVLLQKTLDPPDCYVVEDALNLLVHMKALKKSPRGRYEPTYYGSLLASFSLSFDSSVLILKFGDIGMLHEGILLGILMDTQPLPVLRPFGDNNLYAEHIKCYFDGESIDTIPLGFKEMAFMGNLHAFHFWEKVYKDKIRVEYLSKLVKPGKMQASTSPPSKNEEEWCSSHSLVHSSLNHVAEMYEDIVHTLHQFRPKFLGMCDTLRSSYNPTQFQHSCILKCLGNGDDQSSESRTCVSQPYVGTSYAQTNQVAGKLADVIKQMKVMYAKEPNNQPLNSMNGGFDDHNGTSLCVFFVNGSCNRGNQCVFSHSLQAQRATCKFFFSLQGCRNGSSCYFSHDQSPSDSFSLKSTLCLPEDEAAHASTFEKYFPKSEGCILVMDDSGFQFSSNLARHCDPSKIICTTSLPHSSTYDASLNDARKFWDLSDPYETIISKAGKNLIPWYEVKCIMWFPRFASSKENLDIEKILLQKFFDLLAIRMLADSLHGVSVVLTMNNIRFSQLQVEKLGRYSFFLLTESFPYDEASFGELPDKVTTKKPMLASRPISYVFNLRPPSSVQFGTYRATLRQSLCDIEKGT
ncbi:DExH-box ATP-dependent RNA helicase DExH8 isoform X2 [Momordica charantia]|uniref:RNA helicase n=1 Tax=Momordica charantia TaxID=3673 RepID=A0A6J1DMJ6_MOMCH|nr:DExH-box ATP-dependent RNA helicase DExH8 isoform X2 [Momordica charantia]